MLTPDNRKRIKIREIFSHPWVLEMENEFKEDLRKNSEKTINSNSTNTSSSNKELSKIHTTPTIKTNLISKNTTIFSKYLFNHRAKFE